MDFPASVRTGGVTVNDFIPPGTTYVAGSTLATPNNNVVIDSASPPQPDVDGSRLSWPLDDGVGTVQKAQTFEVVFAVTVGRTPSSADGDLLDNLMKARLFEHRRRELSAARRRRVRARSAGALPAQGRARRQRQPAGGQRPQRRRRRRQRRRRSHLSGRRHQQRLRPGRRDAGVGPPTESGQLLERQLDLNARRQRRVLQRRSEPDRVERRHGARQRCGHPHLRRHGP